MADAEDGVDDAAPPDVVAEGVADAVAPVVVLVGVGVEDFFCEDDFLFRPNPSKKARRPGRFAAGVTGVEAGGDD